MKERLTIGGLVCLVVGAILLTAGLARVGERSAKLTWRDPEIKSALMTLGYKVYANPKVEFGRHYLSKLVFKNTGEHPVKDFSISYKLDDYVPWTDPEEFHEIPAGFTLVKLFYPKLPSQVTNLRNATNTTFRIRVLWKEEGRPHEETFSRDITLRGINELVSNDLPDAESRDWFDANNAAAFAVCMVTPNDPAVALYASEITKMAGGTVAGVAGGGKEVVRLCRTVYDYMMATGMRYTGVKYTTETVDNVTTGVQTVRMPRGMIQTNEGLCIELAILWSSVLEHLGVDTSMIFIRGHVFVIAYSESLGIPFRQGLPIECTAITQRAVDDALVGLRIRSQKTDAPVTFDEAVEMASREWELVRQSGEYIIVPVKALQSEGYIAPELGEIDTDKMTETLAKRLSHAEVVLVDHVQNNDGDRTPPAPAPRPVVSFTTWRHPQGLMTVSLPSNFVSLLQPGAPSFVLLSAGDPATSMSCAVMQVTGTQDPAQAVNYISSAYSRMGSMIQVADSEPGANGTVVLNGTTATGAARVRWTCIAKPVPGGVLLISSGANATAWPAYGATVQAILSSVRFN